MHRGEGVKESPIALWRGLAWGLLVLALGSKNIFTVPPAIYCFTSSDKSTYCKSLWIKASVKCPKCKYTCIIYHSLSLSDISCITGQLLSDILFIKARQLNDISFITACHSMIYHLSQPVSDISCITGLSLSEWSSL